MNQDANGDSYLTIAEEVKAEITVRGSRFIAFISPVETEPGAIQYLKSLKAKYHDATHCCYAFIVRTETGDIYRSSDAGEPAGTAGKPILATLQGHKLSNVICVVIRYFGGTKLGVSGLARAYAESVNAALKIGKVVQRFGTGTIRITFTYKMTGAVERLIAEFNAAIIQREFGETNNITCSIRKNRIEEFSAQFRNITRGKGNVIKE
ncbi:hypothetical protein AMJ80_12315 [bacterium SM23_31]|nr:MAG: hypothetical protein AMJ80_12315 [bacterium SM23_31]